MLTESPVCKLLGIKYPILQGGMASLGTWQLVSAVSEAGGLGIIGSGGQTPDWLRDQIRLTREHTSKPFGVNIMLMSPFLDDCLKVLVEEKVNVVTFGGGNPGLQIKAMKEAGIKIIPVVSSVALARRLERSGVDAIIAEGRESGGHVGDTATIVLVPQVVDAVRVPVIAAGGIADARGFLAAIALGAQAVQMGTRFICSNECIAHAKFKEYILNAQDRATVVTGNTTGHPVRCLENRFTRAYTEMEKSGAAATQLDEMGKGRLPRGVIEGDIEQGSLMAGEIAGLIKDIKPVKTIIDDIVSGAERVFQTIGCQDGTSNG
jgi:enoyl-[acyl-carrier protein] reductase II